MAKYSVLTRSITGLVVGAAGMVGFGSPVAAQTEGQCQTASFDDFLFFYPQFDETPVVSIDLPAGPISVEAHSWDGYVGRDSITQLSEIWDIEFIGADGSIVGVSGPTADVDDLTVEAHWTGSLGEIELSGPSVGMRARHLPLTQGPTDLPQSVHASDVTLCVEASTPTTTSPDLPPSGPTVTAPPACPLDDNGQPMTTNVDGSPVDPDCLPTTTVAECPLDSDGNPVDPSDPDCPTSTTTPPTTEIPPAGPTVTEPATTSTTTTPAPKGPTLPVTGSESGLLLLGSLWLLAAGSTMVAYGRTH